MYCTVAHAVVSQPSKLNQGLVANKSILSRKDITIPRLELIATHMATNLATNIKVALKDLNIRSVTGWTSSTVVSHWLRDQGSYKVFVENRVKKILSHEFIEWKYVPMKQNPADIGSRGSPISKLGDLWWKGPTWLSNISLWPRQPTIGPTTESQVECKSIKEIMTTTIEKSDTFDNLLEKHELYKFLRITAWIKRFLNNCQKTKRSSPLKTDETEHQKKFWIKREQQKVKNTEKFKISKEMLDLQENVEGIYVCRGQIEGSHPVFIPRDSLLAEKLICQSHKNTLHGGVVLNMTRVRSNYWIPALRKLTKSVVRKSYDCKIFNSLSYLGVKPGPLQNDRTE